MLGVVCFLLLMLLSMLKITKMLWFFQLLLTVIQSHALQSLIDKALVLLSDHQKGLIQDVNLVFPSCPHGYYLKHLEQNFYKEFKNPKLLPFLWKAASSTTQP